MEDTTRQPGRKERERQAHRNEILDAAETVFIRNGYYHATVEQIAQEAEFAVGTIYNFFENKEELYKTLMMKKAKKYHRALMEVLAKEEDVLTMLEDYIATKARLFTDSLASLRLYFAETRGASFNIKAGLDQDIRKLYDKFVMQLASVLEAGVRKKVFRKMDPYYMAVALEGLTNAFLFCWLEEPERHSYKANIPVITNMFLKGVLAE